MKLTLDKALSHTTYLIAVYTPVLTRASQSKKIWQFGQFLSVTEAGMGDILSVLQNELLNSTSFPSFLCPKKLQNVVHQLISSQYVKIPKKSEKTLIFGIGEYPYFPLNETDTNTSIVNWASAIPIPILVSLSGPHRYRYQYRYLDLSDTDTDTSIVP